MNLDGLKKQWDDYCEEFGNTEEMDIEKHISMALKVGELIRENERLERCLTQLGQDWSNVVNERNLFREKIEQLQKDVKEWERISDKQVQHLTRNGKEIIKLTEELEIYKDIAESCNCDQYES